MKHSRRLGTALIVLLLAYWLPHVIKDPKAHTTSDSQFVQGEGDRGFDGETGSKMSGHAVFKFTDNVGPCTSVKVKGEMLVFGETRPVRIPR